MQTLHLHLCASEEEEEEEAEQRIKHQLILDLTLIESNSVLSKLL